MKNKQTEFLKLCLSDALIQLMDKNNFKDISISEICKLADVGRTTFYRYFNNKNSKDDLLLFKIQYEWNVFQNKHKIADSDRGYLLVCFIYENRDLFTLLYHHNLITIIMLVMEKLIPLDITSDKKSSYLMSFFIYGYFGIIYQWIKYDFDEKPEAIRQHILDTFSLGKTPRK